MDAMPLVLSLREGSDFYVDDEQIVVGHIYGLTRFEITVTSTTKRHMITEAESIEVLPDVFVSAGDRPQRGIARVAIEAPQAIILLRGDKYRASRLEDEFDEDAA
jgi:hypothetical protein